MEQKSYDKHPENKDSRDDSTVRDKLCRYQGLIFPYTVSVCVCEGEEDEELWRKCAIARTAVFLTLPSLNWVLYKIFFSECGWTEKIQLHTTMLTKEKIYTFVFLQRNKEESNSKLFSKWATQKYRTISDSILKG